MKQGTFFIIFMLYMIMLLMFNNGQVLARESPLSVIIIVDQLGAGELNKYPTAAIDNLQKIGAFGLMNVRTAADIKPESTYLTAGTGKKSKGSIFTDSGENIENGVLNSDISHLQELNTNNRYSSRPGSLGQLLVNGGKKIAVIGNADNKYEKKRTVVSLIMDQSGSIEMGNVGKGLLQEVEQPWGYGTDWEKLRQEFVRYKPRADLIVIETGDLTRLQDFRGLLGENRYQIELEKTLIAIDTFVGFISDQLDLSRDNMGVIVPTPSREQIKRGYSLSWLLLAGAEYKSGWLTSPSTRRAGIVTLTDFLPTVLKMTGVEGRPDIYDGRPLTVIPAVTDWQDLLDREEKMVRISRLRAPFVRGFIGVQLLVILLAIVGIFRYQFIIRPLFAYLILCLFLVPLNYLFISQLNTDSWLSYSLILLLLTLLELLLLAKVKDEFLRVIIVIVALLLVVTIDLATGYRLQADSLLGYSSIIGARYYGLGNEYMGLYIGGGITALAALIEKLKVAVNREKLVRILSMLFLLFLVTVTGSAGLGANFGGLLTALVAGTVTWFKLRDYKFNYRIIILLLLAGGLAIGIFVYLDYTRFFGSRSHIGRALLPLIRGDLSVPGRMITRKLLMNLKLLRWTVWTRILLAFLVYLIIIFWNPVGRLKDILQRYPRLAAGFYGGISGGIATLFINDSGVVACATILFYPLLFLLYLYPRFRE